MSSGSKDSPEVVEFRMLFAQLKKWSKDDPDYLYELAHEDRAMEALGLNLLRAAGSIQKHERLHRNLFVGHVNPKFISEWRDFENRFASTLLSIRSDAAVDGDPLLFSFGYYEEPDQWVMADYGAISIARGLNMTMRYARMCAEQSIEAAGPELDWHELDIKGLPPELRKPFEKAAHSAVKAEDSIDELRDQIRSDIASSPDEAHKSELLDMLFRMESHFDREEHIEDVAKDGWAFWETLKHQSGLDLRGILRRRALIPFILFPQHVSARLSSTDLPSIYQNLRQAHEAFVFGIPFAALALMRSVMEMVVRDHYGGSGDTLEALIKSVTSQFQGSVNATRLKKLKQLANATLHANKENREQWQSAEKLYSKDRRDFELEIVSLLLVLRALIEESPLLRSR